MNIPRIDIRLHEFANPIACITTQELSTLASWQPNADPGLYMMAAAVLQLRAADHAGGVSGSYALFAFSGNNSYLVDSGFARPAQAILGLMDPVTVIGLVGNILTFIDYGSKLFKGTQKVRGSLSGALEDNQQREIIAREMSIFASKLLVPENPYLVGSDKGICDLATECRTLSNDLVRLLDKIKSKDPKSLRQALKSSAKTMWYEEDRKDLEQRLDYCRSQLELQLNFLTSQETQARLQSLIHSSETDSVTLKRLQDGLDQIRYGVNVAFLDLEAQKQLRELIRIPEETLIKIAQRRVLEALWFNELHGRFETLEEAHTKTLRWLLNEEDSPSTNNGPSLSDSGPDLDVQAEMEAGNGSNAESGSSHEVGSSTEFEDNQVQADDPSGNEDIGTALEEDKAVESGDTVVKKDVLPPSDGSETESENDHKDEIHEDATSTSQEDADVESTNTTHQNEASDEYFPRRRMLDGIDISGDNAAKRLAREKLIKWLSSGNGIFHISGKLGSGKSTLMKFLSEHQVTRAELQKWAGDRILVSASFFWRLGTAMQKSLPGLYRALLHDVLESCPVLIPELLPKVWSEAIESPWQVPSAQVISERETKMAFERLIQSKSDSRPCFCFFIDGLDEFEVTGQYDHKDLVDLLRNWTQAAPMDVKICISSREHNVFMDAFPSESRIRLHELTQEDMKNFSRDRLSDIEDAEQREEIVTGIAKKAQGIFLWVALVTRSLRDQLQNGASFADLEEDLNALPGELDKLYMHVFKSFEGIMRKKVFRTLKILDIAKRYSIVISLLAYSFLDEYDKDPGFAMAADFSQSVSVKGTKGQSEALAIKRLHGCKGLLEYDYQNHLEYTHRSVAEFLQHPEVKLDVDNFSNHFNGPDALSQLLLAQLRLEKLASSDNYLERLRLDGRSFSCSTGLVLMRAEHGLDQPPYLFLSSLEAAQGSFPWKDLESNPTPFALAIPGSGTDVNFCGSPEVDRASAQQRRRMWLVGPCYILTYLGYYEYPLWRLSTDPRLTDSAMKTTILAICDVDLFGYRDPPQRHYHPFLEQVEVRSKKKVKELSVLKMLLESSLLSLEAKPHLVPAWFRDASVSDANGLSFWHFILVDIFLFHSMYEFCRPNYSSRVLQTCFRFHPDPHFAYTQEAFKAFIHSGLDQQNFEITYIYDRRLNLAHSSLRSWIEQSGLENKDRLLRMYDFLIEEEQFRLSNATSASSCAGTGEPAVTMSLAVPKYDIVGDSGATKMSELHREEDQGPIEPKQDLGLSRQRARWSQLAGSLFVVVLVALMAIFGPKIGSTSWGW